MSKTTLVISILIVLLSAILVNSAPYQDATGDQSAVDSSPTSHFSSSIATSATNSITYESVTKPNSSARSTAHQSTTTKADIETTTSSQPIDFTSFQNTSTFSCEGKVTGYYADVKLNCHVYHFCTQLDGVDGPSYQRMSYMCLDDSLFDQGDLNCVARSDLKVTCDKAESHYEKSNKQFDAKEESQPSMSDNLAANLMMNPIARFIAGR